jgi:hypothetical protein
VNTVPGYYLLIRKTDSLISLISFGHSLMTYTTTLDNPAYGGILFGYSLVSVISVCGAIISSQDCGGLNVQLSF